MTNSGLTHCAHCGNPINAHPTDGVPEKMYCSFGCEVRGLLGGLGWGLKWLGVSLAWGAVLFALLMLIGRAVLGGEIANPTNYYGLIGVLALMLVILSVLQRRVK